MTSGHLPRHSSSSLSITFNQTLTFHHLVRHHMRSGHSPTTLLFISFHHFQPNLDARSPHLSSHDKWTSPKTRLFISFNHFQPNLDTPSPHPSSHDKWTSPKHIPLHLFSTLSTPTLTLRYLMHNHMTGVHSSSHSSSFHSITFDQTLTLHHLIHHHMTSGHSS